MQVRVFAAACLAAELGMLGWTTREEWDVAVPALLLILCIGLLGFALYWLAVRRRGRPVTYEELSVSSGVFAALVTGGVTYGWGDWMGFRSVLGSLTAGVVVGVTLVLVRLIIWGPVAEAAPSEK